MNKIQYKLEYGSTITTDSESFPDIITDEFCLNQFKINYSNWLLMHPLQQKEIPVYSLLPHWRIKNLSHDKIQIR